MKVTIITGASRGLGFAMATQLLDRGHRLLTLQRSPSAALAAHAARLGLPLEQWAVDLTAPLEAARRLRAWVRNLPRADVASIELVNNAALLAPIADMAALGDDDVALASVTSALRASLEAVVLLTAAFLAASADLPPAVPRKVLNISSGLGRYGLGCTAGYCAAKAGVDNFTRAIALEEATKPNGAAVLALAPGVVDTDMNVTLRSTDPATLPAAAMFAAMKARGETPTAEAAAAQCLEWLLALRVGNDPIGDVRNRKAGA